MNRHYGTHLGMEEILYVYTLNRNNGDKYYFVVDARPLQLIVNFPYRSKINHKGT